MSWEFEGRNAIQAGEDGARGMTTVASARERPRPALGVPAVVVVAIAAGWALAVGAQVTGEAGSLHHDALIEGGPPVGSALVLFLLAWQAMIAAMMLPSSLPLIRLYAVTSSQQPRPRLVLAAFLAGYALVWTAFGSIAFLADVGLHRVVDGIPSLHDRPLLIAGAVLGLAGAFQFSGFKDRCLSKCRHPGPCLRARYRRGATAGLRLGLGHGLFCLGCCWALMLVMFATGAAVLWWMAALTLIMLYEKTGRHGAAATRVVGLGLIALAGLFVLGGLLVESTGADHHALSGLAILGG
jgi:predicted metal-binding membrane protein